MIAFVTFSSVTGVLYLVGVSNPAIKWPISGGFLVIGFFATLCYFWCFQHGQLVNKAFNDLSISFKKDVSNLLKTAGDLKTLDQTHRMLILVDAVNITRNLFIRTYEVGNRCENKKVRI